MKNTTMWLHIPIARENVIVVALGRASPLDYRRYQWKPRANTSPHLESLCPEWQTKPSLLAVYLLEWRAIAGGQKRYVCQVT